jgi:hypothetical protein
VSVDDTSLLIEHTFYGDADLDGEVILADFNRLAASFGATSGARWSQGDFDFNGGVTLGDFNKLAANFGAGTADADGRGPAEESLPSVEDLIDQAAPPPPSRARA